MSAKQVSRSVQFDEPSIFERGAEGRTGASFPPLDVPAVSAREAYGALARKDSARLPEVSEPEVMRHFTRLSQWNYSIDTNFYPLGSCTMKHNPRVNEWAARLSGHASLHPYAPARSIQGALELMARLRDALAEICGMDDVSLQPAAGAQGELTGLMMIRAHLAKEGRAPKKVLIPETAHGTNPASCTLNGLVAVPFKGSDRGVCDPPDVERLCKEHAGDIAAIMITNPNTLGLFETHLSTIAKIVHAAGGLVYGDGANLNALMGRARPGDLGIDVMQFNLHKTFTTPHGGGGPGCGPVAFKKLLSPYQPSPVVVTRAAPNGATMFDLDDDRPDSIGRVRSFVGNFGMMVRAYTYVREMGPEGLKSASELAVLNANYLAARLKDVLPLAYDLGPCMHEAIFSDRDLKKQTGVQTLDLAKRLIDYGFHPPTVYFPLVVAGALMMEPTETETKQTLDWYVEAVRAIVEEAKTSPETVKKAPHDTRLGRLDEARAARRPVLRWTPSHAATAAHLSAPPATHSTEG